MFSGGPLRLARRAVPDFPNGRFIFSAGRDRNSREVKPGFSGKASRSRP
jgi:hypothetical protein